MIQGFDERKACGFQAALNGAVLPLPGFTLHGDGKMMHIRPVLLGGLLRQVFEVIAGVAKLQVGWMMRQLLFGSGGIGYGHGALLRMGGRMNGRRGSQVRLGHLRIEEILTAGREQGAGFGEKALAMYSLEGLQDQGIVNGPGDRIGPVDFAKGEDFAKG
ncbi:MAG: hypothetical protein L0Y58_04750 [Verrucomicrobia subdivision 3 bacterium]|nr:hypothetical protein [Limisphaerales bacterium]